MTLTLPGAATWTRGPARTRARTGPTALLPRRSATRDALAALTARTGGAAAPDRPPTRDAPAPVPAVPAVPPSDAPTAAQRAVDGVTGWLSRRTSRRGFLVQAGVVGSALAVDPLGYVLRPGTAYAAVCGPGASCTSGWTVFCATVNKGVNACPPGSVAAGWWKADGASLCGGGARYIIDCNATCSRCSTPGSRAGICSPSCWSCSCGCGPSSSCDQRRVCCNGFRYGQCNTQIRQVGAVVCRVVSCTPPWRFERCSTSPATDNRTRDHSSSELPRAFTDLSRRYVALGENGSRLGATVFGEVAVPGGRAQRYQRGRISWSPSTGARETVGPIAQRYVALGAEAGKLGFPVTYDNVAPGGRGRASRFQRGRISWSATTGAFETYGAIAARYLREGAEGGPLGYPLTGDVTMRDGRGKVTRFQRGRITTTPGGRTFVLRGAVAERFRVLGGEAGPLGYPVQDDAPVGRWSRYAVFQRGRIAGNGTTGVWEVRAPLSQAYVRAGAERGPLGLPVAGEQAVAGGGRVTRLERGRISWSGATGARWMGAAIARRYVQLGAERGRLGYPVTDEVAEVRDGTATGRRQVTFQRGRLVLDPRTGTVTP